MRGRWLFAAFVEGPVQRSRHYCSTIIQRCLPQTNSLGWNRSHRGRSIHRSLHSTRLDDIFDIPSQSPEQCSTTEESDAFSDNDSNSHLKQRRVRYSGKYPRNFNEKYKELANDEATVQKVLNKGSTPAGRHLPILLNECLFHLGLSDGNTTGSSADIFAPASVVYVDCTLGYGGHASVVLQLLLQSDEKAREKSHPHTMLCFDRDPVEIVKATERLQTILTEHSNPSAVNVTSVNRNFCEIRSFLRKTTTTINPLGEGKVTALLADLGLSSMQIDDASRGFTYKREGPLDMRMSFAADKNLNVSTNDKTESAFDLLSRLSIKEFTKLLQENSDEEHAAVIAKAVVGSPPIPSTTLDLSHRVKDAVRIHLRSSSKTVMAPSRSSNQGSAGALSTASRRKPDKDNEKKQLDSTVARVMQAIRIEVNSEFQALEQLLHDLPHLMASGGRAVILTFHSGEDRRVKKSFKTGFKTGLYSSWSRDVIRPTLEEQRENSRSSCCKLRWVVRSEKPCTFKDLPTV